MQGPWSIFLIQSESEKAISLLLLCIIISTQGHLSTFVHNGLSVFPHFVQHDAFGKCFQEYHASKISVVYTNNSEKN